MDAVSFLIGVAVGGGACSGLGAWLSDIAERKQARKGQASAADHIEKLARLKSQGLLTEEEFQDQKRRCLATVGSPDVRELTPTTALGHVQRLAELRDTDVLTVDEFLGQKSRFIRLGAEGPTAEELAGIEHIEQLFELSEIEVITREDFLSQKREILGGDYAAMAKPSRPWGDFDEP